MNTISLTSLILIPTFFNLVIPSLNSTQVKDDEFNVITRNFTLDEAQASIRTARFAPDFTQLERIIPHSYSNLITMKKAYSLCLGSKLHGLIVF
ncbi:hypothetical protein ERJ71_08465 [Paenibacillus polymyxa]|nr:hypothetical protein CUU60_24900 [Paenibacillus polymyxa ATCC 842]WEK64434.1 hypothetical protein ERJ71_08465 [Paenibacillus polymyxa]